LDLESFRSFCLSLPHATEGIQWGDDLLFRIGGKIFATTSLERQSGVSLKTTPEKFAELLEIEGIEKAAYVGRYHWVTVATFNTLPPSELKDLVRASYDLVLAKLPAKSRAALEAGHGARKIPKKKIAKKKRR
jgi:predicted DNA-binding protein (MmcQ/YjbR family)